MSFATDEYKVHPSKNNSSMHATHNCNLKYLYQDIIVEYTKYISSKCY